MYVFDHADRQPTRQKIVSEVRSSEDIQVWSIQVHGVSIRCAKVSNPLVLTKNASSAWDELTGVQRLEIEDPEGTQSTIPKQVVTELRYLESLSVTWTKIRSLPLALFQLPLNSLYLQRNQIKTIHGVEKASALTILDVSNNHIDVLPKHFGQLQNLVTLNLSGNWLHELPESIGSLGQLRALDCSCNKLKSLPNSLGNAIELTRLDVSTNQLTSLPESIGSLPKLEDLRVRSNHLSSLPDSFGQLHRLNSLLLRNNKFEDVPVQLSRLTSLQSLNMRENMIRQMERAIGPLRFLILDQNRLQQIDAAILQCANLQYLSLRSNNIVEITAGISKLANVRSLNLSDNDVAEVPVELERLTHLHHLSLSSTKVGTIPLAVARMSSLKTLDLDDCGELDRYLNIAYKSEGLPGVITYLNKEEAQQRDDTHQSENVVKRPASVLQNRTNIESLFPVDGVSTGNVSVNESAPRRDAQLSIPGTSVEPPASEAMLHVEVDGNAPPHLDHVARRPAQRPPKPHKPTDLASRHQDQRQPGAATLDAGSAELEINVADPPAGVDDADAVATFPQFGDLTSSSTTETTLDEQQRQSSQHDGETAAQRDPDPEVPVVETRDNQKPALAAENTPCTVDPSRTPATKPRPPVKKKPTKTITFE